MDESLLLKFLGDTPLLRVVDFLIENSIFDYTKTDIAENSGISRASLYNVWPVLEEFGIVSESRKIGNTTLYKLNKANPLVQKLIGLDLELSEQFADISAGKKAVPSPSPA
jgi:DNA-binding transcriptional ArsR family regulator